MSCTCRCQLYLFCSYVFHTKSGKQASSSICLSIEIFTFSHQLYARVDTLQKTNVQESIGLVVMDTHWIAILSWWFIPSTKNACILFIVILNQMLFTVKWAVFNQWPLYVDLSSVRGQLLAWYEIDISIAIAPRNTRRILSRFSLPQCFLIQCMKEHGNRWNKTWRMKVVESFCVERKNSRNDSAEKKLLKFSNVRHVIKILNGCVSCESSADRVART